ncbi:MAG: Cu(I)-responsive transcriptional regulator [Rhodospirillales bacterium]|nr:Cu(I)-responsive transcriptional regulator [Rhodospirillales bacterium]
MNIGEAARSSGVSAKMIRYYEETGLLAPAKRTQGNYRTYSPGDIHTLRFIRRARDLGFDMPSIARLLALWRDEHRSSAEVRHIAEEHIATLRSRIGQMQAMLRTLEHLCEHCHGDARPNCPILDDLAGPSHAMPMALPGADA